MSLCGADIRPSLRTCCLSLKPGRKKGTRRKKLGEVPKRAPRRTALRGYHKGLEHAHPWKFYFLAQGLTQRQTCMSTDPVTAQALLGPALRVLYRDEALPGEPEHGYRPNSHTQKQKSLCLSHSISPVIKPNHSLSTQN